MMDTETKFEAVVQEFGNGAHITVPKDWLNDIIVVENVCSLCPDLFTDAKEGAEVIIEVSNEDVVSGVVENFDVQVQDKKDSMWSQIVVSTGEGDSEYYRVTTRREAGDDGWENEYTVERKLDDVEMEETDEIIALGEDGMWVEDGVVESLAVKQTAPTKN